MGCLISSQNLERLTRNSSEIHCSFFGNALARLPRWAKDAKIACKRINTLAETVDPPRQGGVPALLQGLQDCLRGTDLCRRGTPVSVTRSPHSTWKTLWKSQA